MLQMLQMLELLGYFLITEVGGVIYSTMKMLAFAAFAAFYIMELEK